MIPPVNKIPFTTMHELNLDWVLNELVSRFNAVVQSFNELVEGFNKLQTRQDELEDGWNEVKEQLEELENKLNDLFDKLPEEKIDELLTLADQVNTIKSEVAQESARITQEISNREQADQNLQTQITSGNENLQKEIQDRTAADGNLKNDIEQEATAREQADQNLQTQITSGNEALQKEIQDRTVADGDLKNDIEQEAAAREQADQDLQTQIDALQSGAGGTTGDISKLRQDLTVLQNSEQQHYLEITGSQATQDAKITANENAISQVQNTQADQAARMSNIEQRQNQQQTTIQTNTTNITTNANKIAALDTATNNFLTVPIVLNQQTKAYPGFDSRSVLFGNISNIPQILNTGIVVNQRTDNKGHATYIETQVILDLGTAEKATNFISAINNNTVLFTHNQVNTSVSYINTVFYNVAFSISSTSITAHACGAEQNFRVLSNSSIRLLPFTCTQRCIIIMLRDMSTNVVTLLDNAYNATQAISAQAQTISAQAINAADEVDIAWRTKKFVHPELFA